MKNCKLIADVFIKRWYDSVQPEHGLSYDEGPLINLNQFRKLNPNFERQYLLKNYLLTTQQNLAAKMSHQRREKLSKTSWKDMRKNTMTERKRKQNSGLVRFLDWMLGTFIGKKKDREARVKKGFFAWSKVKKCFCTSKLSKRTVDSAENSRSHNKT